jgi:hypothetical protein
LKEWAKGSRRPQNKEELFNLHYAKLRNVIERIFRVMKARFKILTLLRAFKMKAQAQVVAALCVMHNVLVSIQEENNLREVDDIEEEEDEAVQEYQGYAITT